MTRWIACLIGLAALLPSPTRAADTPPLTLSDGDRVVFVGSALVERDWQYGYFETDLHVCFPHATFTFRNLGWSGDTVWGTARAEFGTQADGYKKLVDEVTEAKPTVLLIAYGINESFAGDSGLPKFVEQYNHLLDDLSKLNAKTWLIGPPKLEDHGRPLPDPTEHNKDVKRYTDAIRDLAAKRGCGFINLFDALSNSASTDHPLTDDEMHFTAYGSRRFAQTMLASLTGSNADAASAVEALRQKIIEKNREYFYRWRPQNDTYIFGFRKHEQGQNAVEIPKFDPIVQQLEDQINAAAHALPQAHANVPAAPK